MLSVSADYPLRRAEEILSAGVVEVAIYIGVEICTNDGGDKLFGFDRQQMRN